MKGKKSYTNWHWGIDPKHVLEWDDPDYPEGELVECGRLVELHIKKPGQNKDTIIRLNRKEGNGSHLVFDPEHPNQRLYILSHPDFAKRMQQTHRKNPDFKGGSEFRAMPLAEIAKKIGGRHGTGDYPKINAAPIGILTHVVYATEKKGDGYSKYIHEFGEEIGPPPGLAADDKGRLWIVGGNYTAPEPGITD